MFEGELNIYLGFQHFTFEKLFSYFICESRIETDQPKSSLISVHESLNIAFYGEGKGE